MIIETQEQLEQICAQLAQKSYITVDTEFLRDKTFYSKLCLIQLAAKGIEPVAVDPIAFDLDYTPLYDLLHNDAVLKVFHAARQDLEIFYFLNGRLPSPLFDTQVAAMVCGYGDSIGYHRLVDSITGHKLSKNAQFTDWSRRPLSKKQLDYALDDVTYLRDVYESLSKQLEKKKRTKWVEQEMEILLDPLTYDWPVEDAWKRVKIRSDKPAVLNVLRELAAWREETARKTDIPRGRIVKDDALADVAVYQPKDMDGLKRIRSLPKDIANGKTGKKLLDVVKKAKKISKLKYPVVEAKKPFPKTAAPMLEMLKLLLKINCSQEDVAAKIVASASDLEKFALDKMEGLDFLRGWRYEVFGKDAQALREGRLMLGMKDGQIHKMISDKS